EYAQRTSDRVDFLSTGLTVFSERVGGCYIEAEARPWEKCPVSLLVHYDFMNRHSPLPLFTSTMPTGTFDVQRLTWGINIELWRQSVLMLNHEHWFLPEPLGSAEVFGVRYAITF